MRGNSRNGDQIDMMTKRIEFYRLTPSMPVTRNAASLSALHGGDRHRLRLGHVVPFEDHQTKIVRAAGALPSPLSAFSAHLRRVAIR